VDSTNKTRPTGDDVAAFLAAIPDERRRADAHFLTHLMSEVTGEPPTMWGPSIVGFGSRHYRYASGREGDVAAISFSPRKAQTVLYLTGTPQDYTDLLNRLGPHTIGKGCLNLKRVDQTDPTALRDIIERSYQAARTT
jgi:hypothetical protein